jgi:hypothetical protein
MCQNCDWENLIERIDEMVNSGDYDWAEDTLTGIRDTVEERQHCSERQVEAVDNIEESLKR